MEKLPRSIRMLTLIIAACLIATTQARSRSKSDRAWQPSHAKGTTPWKQPIAILPKTTWKARHSTRSSILPSRSLHESLSLRGGFQHDHDDDVADETVAGVVTILYPSTTNLEGMLDPAIAEKLNKDSSNPLHGSSIDRFLIVLLNAHRKPIGIVQDTLQMSDDGSNAGLDRHGLIESIALLSNSMVVVAPSHYDPLNAQSTETQPDEIDHAVQAIVRGIQRRQQSQQEQSNEAVDHGKNDDSSSNDGLESSSSTSSTSKPFGKLIFMLSSPPHAATVNTKTKKDIQEWWQRRWASSQPLVSINSRLAADFQLHTTIPPPDSDGDFWRDAIVSQLEDGWGGTNELYDDVPTFQRLLGQVYQVLSNSKGSSRPAFTVTPIMHKATAAESAGSMEQSVPTATLDLDGNTSSNIQDVMSTAQRHLAELEARLEDFWLQQVEGDGPDPNDPSQHQQQLPMIEFGETANQILETAQQQLAMLPVATIYKELMQIASQLQYLYMQQLSSLRDFYGRRYERMIEEINEAVDKSQKTSTSREAKYKAWGDACQHITEGFRAAAQDAIPTLCQPNNLLRDADFEYVVAMNGLLQDMMVITQRYQDEDSLAMELEDDDDDDDGTPNGRKRPRRWYEKLAARALMLGINYFQGWLAWQGVKRAALERDRGMPKFPLF